MMESAMIGANPSVAARMPVRVAAIVTEAVGIKSFVLVSPTGGALPRFSAGSHVLVDLPNGLARQYSLCNDPTETHRYRIAVLREPNGRGGSACMHDAVRVGDVLTISTPRNNFPLFKGAASSLLIAGGIGMTPILAMCLDLHRCGQDFRLHYCTRTIALTAFRDELAASSFAGRVAFHHDGGNPTRGLDVRTLLAPVPDGLHVYCCGPAGLMRAVEQATAHWSIGRVHFEFFAAGSNAAPSVQPGDCAFEIVIASTGQTLIVPLGRTILDVLNDNGILVENMCREGICGTCITKVLEGVPDHRDQVLDASEKAQNKLITVCCSRARTAKLVLDL